MPPHTPGVVKLPGDSPIVAPAIRQSVDHFLASLEAGKNGAMLELDTQTGGNLAIAHRGKDGRWGIAAWVGKSGWDKPLKHSLSGGVKAAVTW